MHVGYYRKTLTFTKLDSISEVFNAFNELRINKNPHFLVSVRDFPNYIEIDLIIFEYRSI